MMGISLTEIMNYDQAVELTKEFENGVIRKRRY